MTAGSDVAVDAGAGLARPASERVRSGRAREAWLIRPAGLVPYDVANAWMHDLAERRARGEVPDALILLEHPPVFTAGRRSDLSHLLWSSQEIEAAGAELRFVDRGGSFTFHGPGQLVGYPIVDLQRRPDVILYLRKLEDVVIRACSDIGVEASRDSRRTGVWLGDRKICAIGVKLAHARVTLHGFALNCATDLSWFEGIVPCGLPDRGVASLSQAAGRTVTVEEMAPLVARSFGEVFGCTLLPPVPAPELLPLLSVRRERLRASAGTPG